jgi:hypothetical protein
VVVEAGEVAEAVEAAVVAAALVEGDAEEVVELVPVGEGADRVAEVKVGWEVCVRGRVGSASAKPVTPLYLMKQVYRVLTGTARIVGIG